MEFLDNYPMSQVTTLGIGGPAKKFVSVSSEEELKEAIKFAKENDLDFLIIGGGSNLLVSDQGVDKLIIKNDIKAINVIPTNVGIHKIISVKSGTVLQDLIDYTIEHGLSGLQKMTGIPGTVGGAVYGNAGAYGQTISDHIIEVTVLNPSSVIPNSLSVIPAQAGIQLEDCGFSYRDSVFKKSGDIILEVAFELQPADPTILKKEAEDVLEKRLVKYPIGIKCPGSFFKNIVAETLPQEILEKIPEEKIVYGKLPAGSLLEEVGAKGNSLDGIYIADYHANLFINKGSGTAESFYKLAKKYAELVYEKYGIKLEPEVQLINLPPIT